MPGVTAGNFERTTKKREIARMHTPTWTLLMTSPCWQKAKLLSLLIPVLEAFTEEAAAIGLEVNWNKTKVQALEPNSQTQRDVLYGVN